MTKKAPPIHKLNKSKGYFECRPRIFILANWPKTEDWSEVTCKVCLSRQNPKHTYKKNDNT